MNGHWRYGSIGTPMTLALLFATSHASAAPTNPQGLYSFCAGWSTCDASHEAVGIEPTTFISGPDGAGYGLTASGGAYGYGSVYRIDFTPHSAHALYSFPTDYKSSAWLKTNPDGNLYGGYSRIDSASSRHYEGLFRLSLAGEFTVLHETDTPGFSCNAPVKDSLGNWVGVAANRSMGGTGPDFIYKLTPDGALKVVYTLGADQEFGCPDHEPVLAADGNLYGVFIGQNDGGGAIYRLAPDDTFTILHTFSSRLNDIPTTPLTIGSDGALYGMHASKKLPRNTLYQMSLDGQFRNWGIFDPRNAGPLQKLILMPDGYLYGLGRYSYASRLVYFIFRFSPAGEYTELYRKFFPTNHVQTSTLNPGFGDALYGTMDEGGLYEQGTLYRYVPPPVQ